MNRARIEALVVNAEEALSQSDSPADTRRIIRGAIATAVAETYADAAWVCRKTLTRPDRESEACAPDVYFVGEILADAIEARAKEVAG